MPRINLLPWREEERKNVNAISASRWAARSSPRSPSSW